METALHIAAGARHREFVEELVKMMMPDELEMQDEDGNTALYFAAASGVREIAKVMVDKNRQLLQIRGSNVAMPLCIAAQSGKQDMVRYLFSNLFDEASRLIREHPNLALAQKGNGETALHVLARMPLAFSSGSQLAIWLRCFFSCTQEVHDLKRGHLPAVKLLELIWEKVSLLDNGGFEELLRELSRLLITAAELGNYGFLTVLSRLHPELLWEFDDRKQSIFHIAVVHPYKDENDNNMLHLAGKLAPLSRLNIDSGAALQMRRELLWSKEVEKIVQPSYREMKNSDGKTPYLLFTEEHKELRQEAEKWMKHTASSCGNDNDIGKPIFLHSRLFMIFAISTAVAVFSSATSTLMFLSILTSRYAEEDFLHSLPNRLMLGLGSLFVSIANCVNTNIMVAFGATHFILLGHDYARIAIPIAAFAFGTVTLFALLQFRLLSDLIRHKYSRSLLSHP
ncbi:hypothetical protein BT93_L1845 [Corymbia citriodora subsp. variegata]|uniref:PGG domain-containing protein n=1 Tax=Corymbia citriodora subsp. variegata TaxID=360336 RepID=A0A8T0CLL3_CORYI|nr:hypothetical protein BT93_L1845 [Corymbia citriodora subsp. variegata]